MYDAADHLDFVIIYDENFQAYISSIFWLFRPPPPFFCRETDSLVGNIAIEFSKIFHDYLWCRGSFLIIYDENFQAYISSMLKKPSNFENIAKIEWLCLRWTFSKSLYRRVHKE